MGNKAVTWKAPRRTIRVRITPIEVPGEEVLLDGQLEHAIFDILGEAAEFGVKRKVEGTATTFTIEYETGLHAFFAACALVTRLMPEHIVDKPVQGNMNTLAEFFEFLERELGHSTDGIVLTFEEGG